MLSFIFGAMNGGKSTLLLQNAYSARSRNFEVVLLGYGGNTREAGIKSRLGVQYEADALYFPETTMGEALKELLDTKGRDKILEILVDEAQFLTPQQVEDLLRFTITEKIDVKCFGLKTNFETKTFPGSQRLFELADELVELDIVRCHCGQKARINARFHSETGRIIASGPSELIEGSDSNIIYDPVCARCYLELGGTFPNATI